MNAQVKMLLDQIDGFKEVHEAYVISPAQYPSVEFYESLETMLQKWFDAELPPACMPMRDAMVRMSEEWEKFENRDNQKNPNPHEGFWRAWENILRLREQFNPPKPLDPIPSVAELAKAGVSKLQISAMWPIHYDDIDKEIANPGSIIKPGTLCTRDQQFLDARREFEAKLEKNSNRAANAKAPKARSSRVMRTMAGPGAEASGVVESDAPEVEAGPDDEDLDEDAIDDDEHGGPLDSAEDAPPLNDEEYQLGDEERVALMTQRGYEPKQIAEYLGIQTKFVTRMLRRQSGETSKAKRKAKTKQEAAA